jgi:hypothetical protein
MNLESSSCLHAWKLALESYGEADGEIERKIELNLSMTCSHVGAMAQNASSITSSTG